MSAYAKGYRVRTQAGLQMDGSAIDKVRIELSPSDGAVWSFDFAGIGAELSASDVDLRVRGVLPIIAVDGMPVGEYDFAGAVAALRGIEGTEVLLTLRRRDEVLELTAVRARVRG